MPQDTEYTQRRRKRRRNQTGPPPPPEPPEKEFIRLFFDGIQRIFGPRPAAPQHDPRFVLSLDEKALFIEIIHEGFRGLSKKYHPDAPGGSHEQMQKLNALRDKLRTLYGQF